MQAHLELGVALQELEGVKTDKGGHYKKAAGLARRALTALEHLTGKAAKAKARPNGNAQMAIAGLNSVMSRLKADRSASPRRVQAVQLVEQAIDEVMRGIAKDY